ncbi:MAG: hypothetical protein ACRBBM_09030 [Pseudomonadaceae bacterium]
MGDSILIVAMGGAGRAIADSVRSYICADLLLINAQARAETNNIEGSVSLTTPAGDSTFYSVRHSRAAALLVEDEITARLEKFQRIILTVGLGGATGSGVAPVVARLASSLGKDVLAAVTLPFAVERDRISIADGALAELKPFCKEIVVHDHEKVTSLMAFNSLDEALQKVADRLAQQVSARLLCAPVNAH